MDYKYQVNRGDTVNLTIAVGDEVTEIYGLVTGVAESYGNADNLRVTIAGISEWFDLAQPNVEIAQVA